MEEPVRALSLVVVVVFVSVPTAAARPIRDPFTNTLIALRNPVSLLASCFRLLSLSQPIASHSPRCKHLSLSDHPTPRSRPPLPACPSLPAVSLVTGVDVDIDVYFGHCPPPRMISTSIASVNCNPYNAA